MRAPVAQVTLIGFDHTSLVREPVAPDIIETVEFFVDLDRAVAELPEPSRDVVELRLGLTAAGSHTPSEVSELLGVTERQVARLYGVGLQRLQARLGADYGMGVAA